MEYDNDEGRYAEEARAYEREDDRDLRDDRRVDGDARARSASPDGRDRMDTRSGPPSDSKPDDQNSESTANPGSNLFVTGIHPRLSEADVTRLFEKYGEVEKCNIMRDPHSGDSRGFGFVKMVLAEQADAAREALQGQIHEGRTLSIEKARRGRPRTPTPGKYYGPPKRETRGFRGGGGRFGDRYGDRYEDRRGGGYGGRREDVGGGYRGGRDRYRDRYDDREYYGGATGGATGGRSYGGNQRDRDDYGRGDRYASGQPPRGEDRYAGRGEDRYAGNRDEGRYGGGRGEERRGYYNNREDRNYGDAAPRESGREAYGGGRTYDERDTKRA